MAKQLKVTPKGKAIYPHLHKADDKFKEIVYKTKLECDQEDAEKLVKELTKMAEARLEEEQDKNDGNYAEVYLDDLPFYDEDDSTFFSLKLNKHGENKKTQEKWENKPLVYDAKRNIIRKVPAIGGGSIIKVSFEPYTWTMPETEGRGKNKTTNLKVGISLRLKGVQIFKLEQYTAADASALGFDEEDEEGFEYDPDAFVADEDNVASSAASSEDNGEDEDF